MVQHTRFIATRARREPGRFVYPTPWIPRCGKFEVYGPAHSGHQRCEPEL